MTRRITGYRHAGYTANGDELTDVDVLSPEERAEDYGWINRRRDEPQPTDPALVDQVIALQATADRAPDSDDVLAGLEAMAAGKRAAERRAS